MADAICGPSNALQQFQKHSSADRTLQQDRQVTRTSQSEEFRTASNINAGILDSEFEAFQAGLPLEPSVELGKPDAARFSGPLSPEYESAAESAAWANDFQRLGFLDGPGASQRSDIGPLASAALNYPAAWQEDFLRQQEDAKYQQACQEFDQAHFVPSGSENDGIRFKQLTGYEALRPIHSQPTSQQMQGTQQPVAQLPDEASFEQAFEAARLELEKQELAMQSQLNSVDSDLNPPSNPVVEQHAQHEPAEVNVKIGADTIDDDREREVEHREIEDDLARTAGQLLESVKDDHGKKFRESSFLELMRDLRDRRRTLTYIRKPADPTQGVYVLTPFEPA